MKRIHLYVLKQLATATFAACAGLFLVALPGVGVNAFAKLGAGGAAAALGFIPYLFGELGQYMLPIGSLMAVVVTFGRLAADNEWLAVTLSGMHPVRVLWPTVLFTALIAAAHYPLASVLAPDLKIQQRQYLADTIVAAASKLSPGKTKIELGDFVLNSATREGNTFYNVTLYIPPGTSSLEEGRTVRATSVDLSVEGDLLHARLVNPVSLDGDEQFSTSYFNFTISADQLLDTGSKGKFRIKLQYLRSSELKRRIAAGELDPEEEQKAHFEIQNRRASSLVYLLFYIWGVPVGLMAQKRSMLSSFAITVSFGIVYYVISIRFLREAGYAGSLSPTIAAWSLPLIGSSLGLLLWIRGLRPRRG